MTDSAVPTVTSPITLPATMRVLERGWLSSNNIVFTGEYTAVVDTGYVSHAPQTLALLEDALEGRGLDYLVNTHAHSDHVGGNAALQAAYVCHTMVPAGHADAIRAWDTEALHYSSTGQDCARFAFDEAYAAGSALDLGGMTWQAIASPGHDMASLMLFQAEEGILLCADALWERGLSLMFGELEGHAGFAAQRATLHAIEALAPKIIVPGHGSPFSAASGAFARALEQAHARLDAWAQAPAKHARHAMKVLVAFSLLQHGDIAFADLAERLQTQSFYVKLNTRYLRLSGERWADEVVRELVAELVKSGAATVAGERVRRAG